MKKIIFSIFLLNSLFGISQMTMKKLDGTVINDGDIITFNVATDPESYLGFKIYNTASTPMNVKVKCVSITNSNGGNLQFCINPICVSNLVAGNIYPNNSASVIPANGQNNNFDHLVNFNTGINPNANVEYTLKFYQIDDSEVETGNSITFTYRYTPALSTNNFESLGNFGVKLKSTSVSNQLEFDITQAVEVTIYDLNSRLVDSKKLASGAQTMNVSGLNKGMYVLDFKNLEGQKLSKKFVKE